jgi:DNA primase
MVSIKKIDFEKVGDKDAIDFLTQPGLVERIIDDITVLGCIGEDRNKLLVYLVATSRKMDTPLACIIRGDSSAGKSHLAETVIKLTPDEEKEILTRTTKQALFYQDEDNPLTNKLVYIRESSGCEEAAYNIRTLLSEKELRLKRPVGIKSEEFIVKGPIAYIETSADETVEAQKATRVFEIWTDDSNEHTSEIHKHQREQYTFSGLELKQKSVEIVELHHKAQKLLKPVCIAIPYAKQIEFSTKRTRSRRDQQKFLDLICAIAFLHQYQRNHIRQNGKEYVEATIEDYTLAYGLVDLIFFQTMDEYGAKSRELLDGIIDMVRKRSEKEQKQLQDVIFTRVDIVNSMGWSLRQVRTYIKELEELEALKIVSGGKGKEYQYRMLRDSDQMAACGLLKPDEMKRRFESCYPVPSKDE